MVRLPPDANYVPDGERPGAKAAQHRKLGATVRSHPQVVEGLQWVKLGKTRVAKPSACRVSARPQRTVSRAKRYRPGVYDSKMTLRFPRMFPSQWNLQNTGQIGGEPRADISQYGSRRAQ